MKMQYSIQVIWSEQDKVYLGQVAELPGCMADGQTPQEAVQNLLTVAQEWIEVANEEGRPVPPPLTLERLQMETFRKKAELQRFIQSAVETLVNEAMQQQSQKQAELAGLTFTVPNFELAGK